jgi:erythromycin esterase-like protein
MAILEHSSIVSTVNQAAIELRPGKYSDYDPLIDAIGDRRFVLIGDASHGTHEFYKERAEITKRLITEKQFNIVAVEADFPDASRVDRFVRGTSDDRDAGEALSAFERFPVWMWDNTVMFDFVTWLHDYNDALRSPSQKTAFYGLDLYSLHASIETVVGYLERTDPEAARRARERYSCLEVFGPDVQEYAYATATGLSEPCSDEVVQQLLELNRRWARSEDYPVDEREALFVAEQNARLVRNAEEYYRTMFRSDVRSWNLRDRHMAETIAAIDEHVTAIDSTAKFVVWAHNSHLGDARHTQMGREGELNVGQLVREKYRDDTFLIGFTTYAGTVTAASDWGREGRKRRVVPALPGSVESIFNKVGRERFMIPLKNEAVRRAFDRELLERAIGVVYRPETERQSHYFKTKLSGQFDVVIHIDETSAIEPLKITAGWDTSEVMETFPSGL